MSDNNTTVVSGGGTSIAGLLGIVFVVLKLTGVIDWSWWLVLLPFYGGLLLLLLILFGGAVVIGIASALDARDRKKRLKNRKV